MNVYMRCQIEEDGCYLKTELSNTAGVVKDFPGFWRFRQLETSNNKTPIFLGQKKTWQQNSDRPGHRMENEWKIHIYNMNFRNFPDKNPKRGDFFAHVFSVVCESTKIGTPQKTTTKPNS